MTLERTSIIILLVTRTTCLGNISQQVETTPSPDEYPLRLAHDLPQLPSVGFKNATQSTFQAPVLDSLLHRFQDEHETRILQCIPFSILHWRISCVCAIILTGFELELYSDDERPFAYWYLSEVCGFHDKVLQQLLGHVSLGMSAYPDRCPHSDATSKAARPITTSWHNQRML